MAMFTKAYWVPTGPPLHSSIGEDIHLPQGLALLLPQLPCLQNSGPSTYFRSFFSHPLSEASHASFSKMATTIPTPFLSALTTIKYIFDLLITFLVSLFPLKFKFPEGQGFPPLDSVTRRPWDRAGRMTQAPGRNQVQGGGVGSGI